ncbi:Bug family tripartite tricarboxylate transporter substrate binding protein [Paracandidimonas lactea]|uniref:Bug family tripartite tricarboxylate transporter substrate binding protein n=1 Tax=Paracandidimonas lactea TaxID=2895524 RepID=UPI001F46A219|nr:tripartite tricarboxylate transporter substrate binding protein [Paracandidimonas lactea]
MTVIIKKVVLVIIGAFLISGTVSAEGNDSYPNRPIRVVVPYAPGGGADSFARLAAPELAKALKTTVIVENRAGGNTAIGAQTVAKAKPDGYTVLFTTDTSTVANAVLYKNLAYNPDELTPVGTLNEVGLGLVVRSDLPVNSFRELVKYVQNNKNLNFGYGSYGVGSQAHMMGEAFNKLFNTDVVHVPYQGAAPAVADVIGGQVLFTFPTLITAAGNVKAGKLKFLAVTGDKRMPSQPDVPTLKELGYEKMSVGAWYGYYVPKDTPDDIVNVFNKAISTILNDPAFVQELVNRGAVPMVSTPQEMQRLIDESRIFTRDLVELTKIKLN